MLVLARAVVVDYIIVVGRAIVEPLDALVTICAVVGVVTLQAGLFTAQAELVVEFIVVVSLAALAQVSLGVGFPEH